MELQLQQSLQLHMTQELITAIEMLQFNALEMDELIMREAEDNVLLEVEEYEADKKVEEWIKSYRENHFQSQSQGIEDEQRESSFEYTHCRGETFSDFLKKQLLELDVSDKDNRILEYLIDNLDERGYFTMDLAQTADILSMETHELYYYLQKLWTLEPKGVGARDLRECLLLQLEGGDPNLYKIADQFLRELANNQLNKIAKAMSLTPQEVQNYGDRIKQCNPIPSAGFFHGEGTPYIFPEIFVEIQNKNIQLEILDGLTHHLSLNPYYVTLLQESSDEETRNYLRKKYQKALFLLETIEKRRHTIEKVVKEIVRAQEDFFLGKGELRPLKLETIADRCNLSESTVSRVSRRKYLQCSQGVFPLKHFFVSGLEQGEEILSRQQLKSFIQNMIEAEDPKRPLSDQKISEQLLEQGYRLKRRTVAKYREEMGIPAASKRKRF